MYPGDKNSTYVGGCCEKFRLGEIFRLESSGCGRGCGRYPDLLGQKVVGHFGLGQGPILLILQVQDVEDGVVWVCSREFIVRSPKWKGNVCGKNLGRLEVFGKTPGA